MLPDTNSASFSTYSGGRFFNRGLLSRSARAAASILACNFPDSASCVASGGAGNWGGAGCAKTGPVPNMNTKSRTRRQEEGRGIVVPSIAKTGTSALALQYLSLLLGLLLLQ